MAISVDRSAEWRAGEGSPMKYKVAVNGTADLTNIRLSNNKWYGDVVVNFNVTIENHPYNSQNSFPAGDFALLGIGDINPKANYPFEDGNSYYKSSLPAPAGLTLDMLLFEFRGDTSRPNPNCVSLWTTTGGNVANLQSAEGSWTYNVNTTKTLELTGSGSQPIITWSSSGAGPNHVEWLDQETWYSAADFYKTIHYDANGGSGAPADQQVVASSSTFTVSSTKPTRKHFDFLGWSTSRTATSASYLAGQTYPMFSASTTTLYAVWEYTYRPGQILVNGVWKSHDRDTDLRNGKYMTMLGRCHIRRNGTWVEMRTRKNRTKTEHSPVIRRNGEWVSMALIGDEGVAHDVGY